MHKAARKFVNIVDGFNRRAGIVAMFIVIPLIGVLIYESISRTLFNKPNIWSIEMAQFIMAAYYILGGAYTLMIDGHVRMDLFYHKWSPKKKAAMDIITFFIVAIYLGILLFGSIKATIYAIEYKQISYSAWKPSLIPIKLIMTLGIFMMFMQSLSALIKDIEVLRTGSPGEPEPLAAEIAEAGETEVLS